MRAEPGACPGEEFQPGTAGRRRGISEPITADVQYGGRKSGNMGK